MNNRNIIVSSNKTIAKYSSDIIKRGLDLAALIENKSSPQQSYLEQGINLITIFDRGANERALDYINKEIKINSNYELAWSWRGRVLILLDRREEAIKSFDRAIEINYTNPNLWYWRGHSLAALSQWKLALQSYDKVIEIQPNNLDSSFWSSRASVLDELENHEEAIYCQNQAIETENDEKELINLYLEQANRFYQLKRYQEAIEFSNKVIDIKECPLWCILDAYELQARISQLLEKYDEALISYNKALTVEPQAFVIRKFRANLLAKLERYIEALNDFEQIVEVEPNSYENWLKRGFILNELENYQEAIISYNKALLIKTDCYDALILKGQTLEKLGNEKEASKLFFEAAAIKVGLQDRHRYKKAIA